MKKLFANAAIAAGFAPLAEGAITHYDIADQVLTGTDRLFFDLDTGSVQKNGSLPGGADVQIRFNNNDYQYINYQNTSGWKIATDGIYYAIRYSLGAAMNFGNLRSSPYLDHNNVGPWNGDAGGTTVFIGLQNTDTREAWIGVRYNDAANTLTVFDFAVAPGSDNMTAGLTVVPEPATTGVVMALLAGCAGHYHRRRQLARLTETQSEKR